LGTCTAIPKLLDSLGLILIPRKKFAGLFHRRSDDRTGGGCGHDARVLLIGRTDGRSAAQVQTFSPLSGGFRSRRAICVHSAPLEESSPISDRILLRRW